MSLFSYSATVQSATIASCANLVQLKSTGASYEILRAWISNSCQITSVMEPIQICRKSAAGDVTAFTPINVTSTNDPTSKMVASSSGCGVYGSSANFGTDTDIIVRDGFNVLNGWLYLPVPEERMTHPSGAIVAMRFPIAVATQTWEGGIVWRELR